VSQPVAGAQLYGLRARDGVLLFQTLLAMPLTSQLWRSDGAATLPVASAAQLGSYDVAGGLVYYLASAFLYDPMRLFRTDGTPAGTLDLGPGRSLLGREHFGRRRC
jgi:hypothetical protein